MEEQNLPSYAKESPTEAFRVGVKSQTAGEAKSRIREKPDFTDKKAIFFDMMIDIAE